MGNKHRKEVIVLFMKSTNTSKISIVFWVALAICTAFVIYGLINDGHSDWCEVVPHSSFDLHFSNNQ